MHLFVGLSFTLCKNKSQIDNLMIKPIHDLADKLRSALIGAYGLEF